MRKLTCLLVLFAVASIAQANLVPNGNFENGLEGWGNSNAYTEEWADESKQGITMTGSIWQNTGAILQADTVYTMTVVARAAQTRPGVRLKLENASGGWAPIEVQEFFFPVEDTDPESNGPWREFSMSIDTADEAYADFAGETLGVGVEAAGEEGWVHVDSVTVVPEPATIAMLSVGALALLRKRRK